MSHDEDERRPLSVLFDHNHNYCLSYCCCFDGDAFADDFFVLPLELVPVEPDDDDDDDFPLVRCLLLLADDALVAAFFCFLLVDFVLDDDEPAAILSACGLGNRTGGRGGPWFGSAMSVPIAF